VETARGALSVVILHGLMEEVDVRDTSVLGPALVQRVAASMALGWMGSRREAVRRRPTRFA
jgi:hypothetical protein